MPRARRQENAEHASLADHAVDLDPPAVLGDDRVADRQAESRAAARRLRGEERLEDLRPVGAADAVAAVDDFGDRHLVRLVACASAA